ncbi:MAG: hypothetical protein OEY22_09160 [Candidatus Bathyarchaeota archaeon]|nr:hypothetical protein [Candidatus Bathyarchaeota archaeon]
MKRKLYLLFSVLLFYLAALTPVMAQDRVVGVSQGDWFRYGDFVACYSSNDPNATFVPPGLAALRETNETEWMLLSVLNVSFTSVLNVSFTSVSLEVVTHYRNGTENTDRGNISINLGDGKMASKVVSANLSVGDSIYSGIHYTDSKISQAANRTYPSGSRETNYMNRTSSMNVTRMNSETLNGTTEETVHWYWDKATGVLVEYSIETVENIENYTSTWSTSYKLIESNLWTVQEPPTWPIIILLTILALIIITVSILIYKRKPKSFYSSSNERQTQSIHENKRKVLDAKCRV